MTEILARDRRGRLETQRKSCEDRDGAWSDKRPSPPPHQRKGKEYQQSQEARERQGIDPPSEPPGRTNTKDTLISSCVCSVTQLYLTLCNAMDCSPPVSAVHWISPGRDTGVGCHFLLQGIFPTQGSNPHLLHWQVDS